MRVHAAWKVRAVRRDARDPYPSRRMIWLAGREDYSLSDDVPRKTVLLYIEKTLTIIVSNAYM